MAAVRFLVFISFLCTDRQTNTQTKCPRADTCIYMLARFQLIIWRLVSIDLSLLWFAKLESCLLVRSVGNFSWHIPPPPPIHPFTHTHTCTCARAHTHTHTHTHLSIYLSRHPPPPPPHNTLKRAQAHIPAYTLTTTTTIKKYSPPCLPPNKAPPPPQQKTLTPPHTASPPPPTHEETDLGAGWRRRGTSRG